MAAEYDDIQDLWYSWLFSRLHLFIVQFLVRQPAGPRKNCLDVGCGTGFQTILLSLCGHEVLGIDIAEELVQIARRKEIASYLTLDLFNSPFEFAWSHGERIRSIAATLRGANGLVLPCFQVGTAGSLPFADATFDIVNCCGSTLSFVNDYTSTLEEVARVRPVGLLILEVDNKYNFDLLWPIIACSLGGRIGYGQGLRAAVTNLVSGLDSHVTVEFPLSTHKRDMDLSIRLWGLSL